MRRDLGLLVGACFVLAIGACGGSGGDNDSSPVRLMPTMTISLFHSDLLFDSTRQSLYAVVSDSSLPPRFVSVDAGNGQVHDLVSPTDPPLYRFVEPVQGTLSLSAQARYLYFTTQSGAVSRIDLAAKAVDLTVSAPTASNAQVAAVAASRTDDSTAYVQLVPEYRTDPDSIGILRDAAWGTEWLEVPRHSFLAPSLAVRSDDAELISRASDLRRVRIGAQGPESVLATGVVAVVRTPDVPRFVSAGILAQGRVYDAASLSFLFDVPGASVCGVLPSRSRLVCAESAGNTGHELFVFDLPTRSRVASWFAGFDTGTIFATTPALRVTPIGAGRVAVSYGSANRLATYGPSVLAVYSNAAFN